MKSLIQKLLRESLLDERLTEIDDDVNLIYDRFFKESIDTIERTGRLNVNMMNKFTTDTSILKSPDSIRANKIKPCIIKINEGRNYYQPHTSTIVFGFNKQVFYFILEEYGGDLKNIDEQYVNMGILKEFSEEKIKGTIHHELVHWIDDVFNNNHITNRIKRAMELRTTDLNGIPVNASKMEIQAQIHNIKQGYNKYKDIWDTLSFDDMVKLIPTIRNVYNSLTGLTKDKWVRAIKTRMNRENLLGAKMR